jgi:hypothetical protein
MGRVEAKQRQEDHELVTRILTRSDLDALLEPAACIAGLRDGFRQDRTATRCWASSARARKLNSCCSGSMSCGNTASSSYTTSTHTTLPSR